MHDLNKASAAGIPVPGRRMKVDPMYFVKMIKMAKLTVLCIEDDIANALYLICTSARMEKVGD